MNATLKEISYNSFKNSGLPILFTSHPHNRKYGIISNANFSIRVAWQSDLIEPEIMAVNPNIYAVGIDQNWGIFDCNEQSIILTLKLFYNFTHTLVLEKELLIISELEIHLLDRFLYQELRSYSLPDFFEDIQIFDQKFIVECFGGAKVEFARK